MIWCHRGYMHKSLLFVRSNNKPFNTYKLHTWLYALFILYYYLFLYFFFRKTETQHWSLYTLAVMMTKMMMTTTLMLLMMMMMMIVVNANSSSRALKGSLLSRPWVFAHATFPGRVQRSSHMRDRCHVYHAKPSTVCFVNLASTSLLLPTCSSLISCLFHQSLLQSLVQLWPLTIFLRNKACRIHQWISIVQARGISSLIATVY